MELASTSFIQVACTRAKIFDAYSIYVIPKKEWTWGLASLLIERDNQKKAWVRLVVSALETNFFLYRSNLGLQVEEDSP